MNVKTKLRSISIQASRSEYRVIFDWMNRKLIPYGTKLPVAFSSKELEDIRSCIMICEEFGRHAVVDGKRFHLNLSLDDIEDLQGHVAGKPYAQR
jgi:hypothetical protein